MKHWVRRIIRTLVVVGIIYITGLVGVGYYEYQKIIQDKPIQETIGKIQREEKYTLAEDISPTFLEAVVAIEDHRFYKHSGIDLIAIIRAFGVNLVQGKLAQGGSTITQQVAKNIFLTKEKTILRKIEEAFLAGELEKTYSKEKILELYVNVVYYGDGNHGIYEASQNYFDTTPEVLTYEEATLLAGLPQAPSRYALSENYDAAKQRQIQVIEAMKKME